MAKKAKKTKRAKRSTTKLAGMDFESLMDLRKEIDDRLQGFRSTLEQQLASLGGTIASLAGGRAARDGRSKMKGKKVAPKYRGPGGELWAGRGAKPRWLVAALKEGKKAENFLIDKTAGKRKRKAK